MPLTLTWVNSTPAPALGYRVRYRIAGSSDPYTTVVPNPVSSPCVIPSATGLSYEGTIEASCGNDQYGPVVNWTVGAATTWATRKSVLAANICSELEQSLYTAVGDSFTTGTTVYTDPALTTPLVGYNFISELITGIVYEINSTTGVIGINTGSSC